MHLAFTPLRSVCLLAVLGLSLPFHIEAAPLRIEISAGPVDRQDSLATFALPPEHRTLRTLRDAAGGTIPVQVEDDGTAAFLVPRLRRGERLILEATTGTLAPPRETIQVQRRDRGLAVTAGGHPVLEYQAEPGEPPRPDIRPIFRRGGYIHPVFSPSGRRLTDDYPSNHQHHHGIWFPWTRTEFEGRQPDFWNMGEGKGRVEFHALDTFWSGAVHGGFRARHRFIDLTSGAPKVALDETWTARVHEAGWSGRKRWVFDLTSIQTCAGSSPLRLPKYHYGGLGFRGHWDWNGPVQTQFLTSEGLTNRIAGNETRGRWCHVSGLVQGARAGAAILGHPSNFRAPQPMRLHPTEPFFCFAPSQLGDWEIVPGRPYVSRYRFVIQDGDPDRAELDLLWEDYAHPIEVRVLDR